MALLADSSENSTARSGRAAYHLHTSIWSPRVTNHVAPYCRALLARKAGRFSHRNDDDRGPFSSSVLIFRRAPSKPVGLGGLKRRWAGAL